MNDIESVLLEKFNKKLAQCGVKPAEMSIEYEDGREIRSWEWEHERRTLIAFVCDKAVTYHALSFNPDLVLQEGTLSLESDSLDQTASWLLGK